MDRYKTDTKDKANVCNMQFQSAFMRETGSGQPSKGLVHSPLWKTAQLTHERLINRLAI